jgi:hypothetical protein
MRASLQQPVQLLEASCSRAERLAWRSCCSWQLCATAQRCPRIVRAGLSVLRRPAHQRALVSASIAKVVQGCPSCGGQRIAAAPGCPSCGGQRIIGHAPPSFVTAAQGCPSVGGQRSAVPGAAVWRVLRGSAVMRQRAARCAERLQVRSACVASVLRPRLSAPAPGQFQWRSSRARETTSAWHVRTLRRVRAKHVTANRSLERTNNGGRRRAVCQRLFAPLFAAQLRR